MARKFLYIVAVLIGLVIAVLFALRLFGTQLSRMAFVPSEAFAEQASLPPNAYASNAMWIGRPGQPGNPAMWRPKGLARDAAPLNAAVFFIHPTSYLARAHWNASLDNAEANERAIKFVRAQASVFGNAEAIWVPRYRQATLGAFLTEKPEGRRALESAYRDVLAAFDFFIAQQPPDTPVILGGHSQGGMHLARLLKDRVAGKPVAKRIVAAYVIGWPIPVSADLPALGLPGCTSPEQTACVLSWQSFAEPAEYGDSMALFEAAPGLAGTSRKGDRYLCINPLTGKVGGMALASANHGMLRLSADFNQGEIVRDGAPARCDAKGFLLIGPGPDLGPYVLPNNNYHMYDFSLFWINMREDVARRTAAFVQR
jgi:hypothetical protein